MNAKFLLSSILFVGAVLVGGHGEVRAAAPTSAISGDSFLDRDETGQWTCQASDQDGDLLRWRVRLNGNDPQWTGISGSSATLSFPYSFPSSGINYFELQVQDVAGNVTSSGIYVQINHAPTASVWIAYLSPTSLGIAVSADDVDENMDYHTLLNVGVEYYVGPGAPTPNGSGWTTVYAVARPPAGTYTIRYVVGDTKSIAGDPTRYGIAEVVVTIP